MPWRDEIVSNPKIASAHGGILSALIDLTGLYTILAAGGTPRATIDLHVDFHRPALPGQLRAIGRLVKMGRQISFVTCVTGPIFTGPQQGTVHLRSAK
jgi:uncharacterized protein (TIGR00369 family)